MNPAELIAQRLQTGLIHPGNGQDQKPLLIPLPAFRTTGMPQKMADHVKTITQLLGQAIIHLLTTEAALTLIPTAELAQLHEAIQPETDPQTITIECPHHTRILEIVPKPLIRLNLAEISQLTQGCPQCTPASPSTTKTSTPATSTNGNNNHPKHSANTSTPTPPNNPG